MHLHPFIGFQGNGTWVSRILVKPPMVKLNRAQPLFIVPLVRLREVAVLSALCRRCGASNSCHATKMQTRAMEFCAPYCGNGCCVLHLNEALRLGHEAQCLPEAVFARAPRGLTQIATWLFRQSLSIIYSEMPSSGSPWPSMPRERPRSGRECVKTSIPSL